MRVTTLLALAAGAVALGLGTPAPASAEWRNPSGVGIYTPGEPPYRARLFRYDPYSWYFKPRGYYPYYYSGYWVPRAQMRYRYRYVYRGPQYRYYPAWGYGLSCCGRWW